MRRRLLITYVTLLAAVLVGLDVALGATIASRDAQAMFIDRLNDTARFAALAEPLLRTGLPDVAFSNDLDRYDEMFGIAAAVFATDGHVVVASREGLDERDAATRAHIEAALSGRRAGFAGAVWPWGSEPLIVAEPIGTRGEIIGAMLTVSPTGALHRVTWRNWAALTGLSCLILLIGWASAGPLARWMLQPVHDLDDAAHALSEGRFADRVVGSGPPELRRLATSFNTMAVRIAALVARQRSFVSYASHQLRTPLATLRLCVENLQPWVRPAGRDDYRLVADEIERLADMCDALLVYARAEATADDAEEVDAVEIADSRVAVWTQAATAAGIRLTRDGVPRALVRVTVQALDQALDALLSNAVKFAGPGAEVAVTVEHADAYWVDINVVDNGPGISAADLPRAAEAFWRGTANQNIDGSGLGITVADALVTASRGRLDLMPAHPHGLHARIRLPASWGG